VPSLGADPKALPLIPVSVVVVRVIVGTGTCDAAADDTTVPSLLTSSCEFDVVQNRLDELWFRPGPFIAATISVSSDSTRSMSSYSPPREWCMSNPERRQLMSSGVVPR